MKNLFTRGNFSMAAIVAGFVMFAGSANGASLTIDDFSDADPGPNQIASQTGVGTNSDTDTGLTGVILPGTRELFVEVNADPDSLGGVTRVLTTPQVLDVSMDSNVDGYGEARYLGLNSVDLLLGEIPANAYLQALVVFADQNVVLTATVTDESANVATFTSASLVTGNFVNQAFGSFANAGSVDFTDIDSIVIRLSGPTSFQAQISLLEVTTTPGEAVPEPSTAALAVCGLFGLGWLACWRKRAKT